MDGTTGIVVLGAVELVLPELTGDLDTILELGRRVPHPGCARQRRQPRGRTARPATSVPQGIGLCRTEHMFLGDRKQIIQTFILNDDEDVRQKAVDQLFEAQTGDFYGMFKAMDGLPVIVRLLDPPLHEFLESPRALERARSPASRPPAATRASSPRSAPLWSRSTPWQRPTPCWVFAAAAWASCTPSSL